jgi:hypothetical protein
MITLAVTNDYVLTSLTLDDMQALWHRLAGSVPCTLTSWPYLLLARGNIRMQLAARRVHSAGGGVQKPFFLPAGASQQQAVAERCELHQSERLHQGSEKGAASGVPQPEGSCAERATCSGQRES